MKTTTKVALILCSVALVFYMWHKTLTGVNLAIDNYSFLLFYTILFFLLIPEFEELNFLTVFGLKRKIKETKEQLYRREVVIDEFGKLHFIDSEGCYHEFADNRTANFFVSSKGIFQISRDELNEFYKPGVTIESAFDETEKKILNYGDDFFLHLNHRKLWLSMSKLYALNLEDRLKDIQEINRRDSNKANSRYLIKTIPDW